MLQNIALCKVFLLNFWACGWFLTVFKWKLLSSYFLQYYYISPGEYSWEFLVGVCHPVLQILTLFQTKKKLFFTPVLRPGPVFRPGLEEIMSSLLRTASIKMFLKFISNSYVSLSFLLTRNSYTLIDRSKTIPDSRPKRTKCIPVFRPKRRKTPTPWGGTHLHGLYKGVPPGILLFSTTSWLFSWFILCQLAVDEVVK